MKNRKLVLLALGLMAFATLSGLALHTLTSIPQAPAANYTSLRGEKISTASLQGQVYLVNFWATTCTTCVAEMPELVSTYQKYAGRGFKLIAVAMRYDRPDYVLNFSEDRKLPFTVALDSDGQLAEAFDQVILTPTSFIIDKQGRILKRYLGKPDFAELHALIEQALAA